MKNFFRLILVLVIAFLLFSSTREYISRKAEIEYNKQSVEKITKENSRRKIELKEIKEARAIAEELEKIRKEEEEIQRKKELAEKTKVFTKKTQFVALAFDGSRSNSSWEKTLAFAQELKSENIPLIFTYFISGVYLLPAQQKKLYNLSWKYPGKSDINFGDSVDVTNERIKNINRAVGNGHEIASHLNGHFDGSKWSEAQWNEEIDFFNKIIDNNLNTKIIRNPELNISSNEITGMRSPLLSRNTNLYKSLRKNNYSYDTSKVNKIGAKVSKDGFGIWQFPLVYLTLENSGRTLSMDYNHFLAQTNARSTLKKGTQKWKDAKKEVLDEYISYFEKEYDGSRSPINIGHHFSMWNEGLYWEVMKDFAREVCGKKDVVCTNYKTIVNELEKRSN